MEVLNALIKIQKRDHVTNIYIATLLGISVMHWWRIRKGRNELKFQCKEVIVNRWPELQPIFLSEIVNKFNK